MKKLLLFVMMLFLVCGCSKNSDELVMVTEAGFAPYEYYRDGEIVGVDVDIAKEIAKELGKELVIKDIAFDSIVNEVKTGKADFGQLVLVIVLKEQRMLIFQMIILFLDKLR